MRIYFVFILLSIGFASESQVRSISRDSLNNPRVDSLIKQKLIELAMKNPALNESNALIGGAQYELKQSKTLWLNTVTLSGNVNEFVINQTVINGQSVASYFPKYNIGVNVPLGLFGRQDKNISKEKVKVFEAQKETRTREIKKIVLIRYEDYKEKKELLELQKQITDGQYSTYQQKQKDFANGEVNDIKDVNKEYELWILQRSTQRTRERDLQVAQLELEEIIGIPLEEALASVANNK